MNLLTDTSPDAQQVLDETYRRMTPARKWAIVADAYRFGRALHASGVRLRQPTATEADIRRDWIRLRFCDAPWLANGCDVIQQPAEHQRVILEVLAAFERAGIVCAVGGSIASSLHGIPRYTEDADLTAAPFPGREETLTRQFGPDFYVSTEAVRQAVRDRSSFNIIHPASGLKIDVFIHKIRPFDQNLLARRITRTDLDPSGQPIAVLSAEDVLLLKLERFRLGGETSDRQWGDILGVLRVQGGRLDEAYLDRWAAELNVPDLLAKARTAAAPPPASPRP
ncbi:MAG TPA: hypothetical protein VH120_19820 [Gemmataceae bacterium]|jgi:hypothetical protein|nr:hypothetical protein [Gemmataceae bacterium]